MFSYVEFQHIDIFTGNVTRTFVWWITSIIYYIAFAAHRWW